MKKVLVAEDDTYLANAYKLKLAKSGFKVKVVTDGEELLGSMGRFKPDIIVLDLVMPIKDGFSTIKELKEHKSWCKIPLIIASNLGQKEDIDKGLALGADDYIVKSDYSLEDLVSKILKLLKND